MKILLDTNFLYSALFHPTEKFNLIIDTVFAKHEVLVLDYVAEELVRKAETKRPEAVEVARAFLQHVSKADAITDLPGENPLRMRDPKDQPILDAAIRHGADIIITGDKDFAALDIDRPRIMTPAQFIAEFMQE